MIRMLIGFAAGAAIGYSISRYVEAKAAGVPLDMAFKLDAGNLLKSVRVLKAQLDKQNALSLSRAQAIQS